MGGGGESALWMAASIVHLSMTSEWQHPVPHAVPDADLIRLIMPQRCAVAVAHTWVEPIPLQRLSENELACKKSVYTTNVGGVRLLTGCPSAQSTC